MKVFKQKKDCRKGGRKRQSYNTWLFFRIAYLLVASSNTLIKRWGQSKVT